MKFCYSNKDDPRLFVYRDEYGPSGLGVTLNFAHRKALRLTTLWLILLLAPVAGVFLSSTAPAGVFLMVAWSLGLTAYIGLVCYRGASRDLKRHPGSKGPRDRGRGAEA